MSEFKGLLKRCLDGPFLCLGVGKRLWRHLPARLRCLPPFRAFGMYLQGLVQRYAERRQNHDTFFFRNRPELELMSRLANLKSHGSSLEICVLGCSKGAEVYSIAWTLRSARPDLKLRLHAVDLSQEILDFAKDGVYSVKISETLNASNHKDPTEKERLTAYTTCQGRDQKVSIFERMTEQEIKAMFDMECGHAKVKSWLKEGIIWHHGDAGDAEFLRVLGPQEIVVANRFLCHMEPMAAERCLHNISRLVKPSGYLIVSGVDLQVRTRVARELAWKPVMDLIREIHEGDVSLLNGWPLEYWALEPFQAERRDSMIRYASVFQLGV